MLYIYTIWFFMLYKVLLMYYDLLNIHQLKQASRWEKVRVLMSVSNTVWLVIFNFRISICMSVLESHWFGDNLASQPDKAVVHNFKKIPYTLGLWVLNELSENRFSMLADDFWVLLKSWLIFLLAVSDSNGFLLIWGIQGSTVGTWGTLSLWPHLFHRFRLF